MLGRLNSFKLFLCLETLPVQDGKHKGSYGGLYLCYSFIFTEDAVSLRSQIPSQLDIVHLQILITSILVFPSPADPKHAQPHRYARPHITEALWYYLQPVTLLLRSLFSSVSAKNIHLSESFPCNHNIEPCAFNLRFSRRQDNKDIGIVRQSCKNEVEERSFDDNFCERMRRG